MISHPPPWVASAAGGLLALALLGAPLPFGSVVPEAAAALRISGFGILALAVFAGPWSIRRSGAAPGIPWAPAAALLALAALAALQSLPLPVSVVETVSPEHARAWRDARSVLEPGAMPRPALSLAPAISRQLAWWRASLVAAFLAAALVGRWRIPRRALALAAVAAALFQVLYGARRWLVRASTIWGLEVPGVTARLRGTYVNPNHLATYLGIALPLLFAWGWWAVRRARWEVSAERRLLLVAPPAVLGLTVLCGLAFTGSRGGLAGSVVGLLAMGALPVLARRRRTDRPTDRTPGWRRLLVVPVLAILALGVVGLVGFEEAYSRFATTSLYEVGWGARTQVYRATLDLWRDYPWLGTGAGSFRDAFPRVQPAQVPGTWTHAHSDPLELLATGGLLALGLAVLGLATLLIRLTRGLRLGVQSEDRAAALAGLGIVVSLLVHETVDYGLTMPANAFTAAVLLGAAASVPLRRSRPEKPPADPTGSPADGPGPETPARRPASRPPDDAPPR